MNIEEAIKELKDTLDARRSYLTIAEKKAIQLGIEALERGLELRDIAYLLPFRPGTLDLARINEVIDKIRKPLPSEEE